MLMLEQIWSLKYRDKRIKSSKFTYSILSITKLLTIVFCRLNVGLVLNANELDTQLKVSAGSNNYVDFFLKGTRGLNANGALKLNVDQILTANGQIKSVKGVGNANIVIKLLKVDKELKVDSTYTIQNPVYNVEVSFYPNFGKDKGDKFTLSTKNKITENSIDSTYVKIKIDVFICGLLKKETFKFG